MPNEEEIRLSALVAELRAHISDMSLRSATLAGEVAVLKSRNALLEGRLKSQEKETVNAPDRN